MLQALHTSCQSSLKIMWHSDNKISCVFNWGKVSFWPVCNKAQIDGVPSQHGSWPAGTFSLLHLRHWGLSHDSHQVPLLAQVCWTDSFKKNPVCATFFHVRPMDPNQVMFVPDLTVRSRSFSVQGSGCRYERPFEIVFVLAWNLRMS